MTNKKIQNLNELRRHIKLILSEMSASVDREHFHNLYDKENQGRQPDKLQMNVMSRDKWSKEIVARLKHYKNVHVYVYPFSTSYSFSKVLGDFKRSSSYQKFLSDNESFTSFNAGERTVFATTESLDIFLDFLKKTIEEEKEKFSEDFFNKFLHNIQAFKKVQEKISQEKTKSCALISVGSADIEYLKEVRDLNTGWMAIHKLFDAPDFLNFLNKKLNMQLEVNNKSLAEQGFDISAKIANFNMLNKKGQGKNRNVFRLLSLFPTIIPQPYNFKFQDKNVKGGTYLNLPTGGRDKIDILGPNADPQAKRMARNNYLRIVKNIQDPTEEDFNSELDTDEYISSRPIQDFLPEMITYALGWFIDKNSDGTYTVWDWDEDIKQGETKVMTPEEVTLRFFQKDAYDMSSEVDSKFLKEELMPFFEGVVLKIVINVWNYFKGKIIINFN